MAGGHGLVGGEGDLGAVDGVVEGGGGDGAGGALDLPDEVCDEEEVAAAVGVVLDRGFDFLFVVAFGGLGVGGAEVEEAVFHDALDFALGADDVDGAAGFGGAADHGVGGGGAVGELDDEGLVVDDVVVGAPDAAAVGVVGFEGVDFLFEGGVVAAEVFDGFPDVLGEEFLIEVDGFGGVGAGGFDLAIGEAACAGAWGGVFFAEEGEAAEGVDGGGCDAGFVPGKEVEVVAAFGHEHGGAALGLGGPFSADEADGHVEVADVLGGFDGEEAAEGSREDEFSDFGVEGGVAEDVADHDGAVGLAGGLLEGVEVGGGGGDGFFEEDVESGGEEGEGGGDVEGVHGAVDDGGGEVAVFGCGELFEGGEAVFGGEVVLVGKFVEAEGIGVDDGGDFHFVGMLEGVGGVDDGAMAGAEDGDWEGGGGHVGSL